MSQYPDYFPSPCWLPQDLSNYMNYIDFDHQQEFWYEGIALEEEYRVVHDSSPFQGTDSIPRTGTSVDKVLDHINVRMVFYMFDQIPTRTGDDVHFWGVVVCHQFDPETNQCLKSGSSIVSDYLSQWDSVWDSLPSIVEDILARE